MEERYEIKGRVGEGGRGAVYRAFDRQLNRHVAIKRLFTNGAGQDASDDVMKESHALSAINSPHIVRVFDIDRDAEGPYVVMELLEGKTLHEIVSRAPLVRAEFLTVAEQSLEALIAAHDSKLLHRDIKPGNLMLTWLPSGRLQLKLLDFGLAKFTERPSRQTGAQEGSVLGSIYFMAPEQFERQPLDARSDLYSLGCVLYYALTGGFPFHGESAAEVMAAHVQGNCADLHPLRPDLPPAVSTWVMSLISRDMEDRPASAQDALDRFEVAKRDRTPVATSVPAANGPRLITGIGAETGTILVNTSTQPVHSRSSATSPVPTHTTTTTTLIGDPGARSVRGKSTTIPPWALAIGGVMLLTIVALGLAMVMRGDPAKTVPPPIPVQASEDPGASPDPGPAPTPPEKTTKPEAIPPKQEEKPPWNAAAEFKKKDKNTDFKITRDEFVRATTDPLKSQQEQQFIALDKNNDGALSLSEFKKQRGSEK